MRCGESWIITLGAAELMAVSCIEPGEIMAKMCKNARTDLATCNNGPAWNTQTGNTALIQSRIIPRLDKCLQLTGLRAT